MASTNKKRVILCYPNSGEQWNAETQDWVPCTGCSSPEAFADTIMEGIHVVKDTWRTFQHENVNDGSGTTDDLSASSPPKMIMGGCCRTTPDAISAIRRRIDLL